VAVSLRSRKKTALIRRVERAGRSKEEEMQRYEAKVGAAGFKRPRKVRNMSARALVRALDLSTDKISHIWLRQKAWSFWANWPIDGITSLAKREMWKGRASTM